MILLFTFDLNFAIAKFTGDERQQTRRRTCVPQVAVNEADSVKLVIPKGGKYRKTHSLSSLINEDIPFLNEH